MKARYRGRQASAAEDLPIVELVTGEPAHGGAVVARDADGRVVFVRHALPGERVRARITAQRKHLAWADAVEVLEASPDRVPSVWPEAGAGGVGAGELSHVSLSGQRRWKSAVVRDQFRRVGGVELFEQIDALGSEAWEVRSTVNGDVACDELGWRSRAEFVIDRAGRPAMHAFRRQEVVALSELPLAMPEIVATGILDEDSVWPSLWKAGDRVRVVCQTGVPEPRVLVAIGDTVYSSDGRLAEDSHVTHMLTVGQRSYSYRVRMQGFWQAHRRGAGVLANTVCDFGQFVAGDRVLELFSGAGLFSAVIADQIGSTGHLVTVEGDEAAVADAAANVAPWGNVDPCVGWIDREAVLDAVGMLGAEPRVIVLDPPRDGAGQDVCAQVTSVGAQRIVVVSCDVAAGARDLRSLCAGGYRVADFKAWDLYPYTHHVETVTVLTRVSD